MDYVDYDGWVDYVLSLLERHDHRPQKIHEIGCGTGKYARKFVLNMNVEYLASDGSFDMIAAAEKQDSSQHITYRVLDFVEDDLPSGFDTVFLLFDGINYLLKPELVGQLLTKIGDALPAGGLVVVDQSTPQNSLRNRTFFEDSGAEGDISYTRTSLYDEELSIHTTTFHISTQTNEFEEIHTQRSYTREEMVGLINQSKLKIEGAYDGFSLETADNDSERIHWVLRKT